MGRTEEEAKRVFGARVQLYVNSACHTEATVLDQVVAWAAPRSDWHALDIATGPGHTAFAIAPRVAQVIAVDLTPEMIATGQALAQLRDITNVSFRTADAHALPFADDSFDLVTCRRAPHHFSDLPLALAEMRRVLRFTGRLLIDDRSVPEDDDVDRLMDELDRLHDPSHVRQHRLSQWRHLLESAGFAIDREELYTRLRPVSALTDGVEPEQRAQIEQIFATLTDAQREKLGVTGAGESLQSRHWYVMIAGH